MSQENKHWDAIIEQYKASGLSQPAFCKQNNLSYNQFQYRWYLYNRTKKTSIDTFNQNSSRCNFETVTISLAETFARQEEKVSEMMIHLPNQINIAVKMDLRRNGFSSLLKELVRLC